MTTEREFLGVWIPKNIYLHKGLTPTEKLLLAEITSFAKNGICFASNEHFSDFLGVSKKHVSRLVTNLSRMGLINVQITYKEGTKEVDKRLITPMRIEEDTPTHSGVDPLHIQEDTPTHLGDQPPRIDAYYKEQSKSTLKEQVKDKKINKKENSPVLDREFDSLWKLYPRKIGKKKAFDAYKKARKIKKIPYEIIENGLYRYIRYLEQQGTDEQYIMHGSTWFGQEKWQDEYTLTGLKQKPKDINEYMRQKYGDGGQNNEPQRDRKIINDYDEFIPDVFQGI
jgi:Mn-dependent DtxR family transcriptional regulator